MMYALPLLLLLLVLVLLHSRQSHRHAWHDEDEADECRFFNQVYGEDTKNKHTRF